MQFATNARRAPRQVYEVDAGAQAESKGVQEGYLFVRVGDVDVRGMPFFDIDALFDQLPMPITVTFDARVCASSLYAVELPAAETVQVRIAQSCTQWISL